jgi:hypothetical protein
VSEWADHRLEVFGEPYLVWHDGADFDEIAGRYAADPALVLRMLRAGIREGDAVAAAAGVRDPEYLVRFHSANTLLHWAGRAGDISEDEELFDLVKSDASPEQWAEAARRLAAVVEL